MRRVLEPSGRVVITDWCDDFVACWICDLFLQIFNRAYVKAYGENQCRRMLKEAGFAAVRIDRFKINWLWGLMTAVGEKHTDAHSEANAPSNVI